MQQQEPARSVSVSPYSLGLANGHLDQVVLLLRRGVVHGHSKALPLLVQVFLQLLLEIGDVISHLVVAQIDSRIGSDLLVAPTSPHRLDVSLPAPTHNKMMAYSPTFLSLATCQSNASQK